MRRCAAASVSDTDVPCYHPLDAWRLPGGTVTFNWSKRHHGHPIQLPCGQCAGCRVKRSREWALRCVHEASLHAANSFVTLTYSDTHLPDDYSVSVRDLQLFHKRLRKEVGPFRFLACGEYGETTQRPHYHALYFGYEPDDAIPFKDTPNGILYTSDKLANIWGLGHVTVGPLTFASAAYTCRYTMKKRTGPGAAAHYARTHPFTGEQVQVKPEFITQSRRPGLASAWFDKYQADCFPSDFLVHDGRKVGVPRFYEKKAQSHLVEDAKHDRAVKAVKHRDNNTPERLKVRETVHLSRLKQLPRKLED